MTDLPTPGTSVPSRLGTSARLEDGDLVLELTPRPEVLCHGVVRASVLAFLIDAAAGIALDRDPDMWTLTTDLSVRMRPVAAPNRVDAFNTILRAGWRSSTCRVELTSDVGAPIATGAIGFATVPRKPTDGPKPTFTLEQAVHLFRGQPPLTGPLREEAGIEVIDAAAGVVEVALTADLRNPAGTLQGAMVALVAEAATEELVASAAGSPVIVTDLDLRYLERTQAGPVRTRSRLLGPGPDAAVQVELVDLSTDRTTTLVYARAVPVP
jgi:acyl-coenzyme A thioesterase PaaI-like protein